MAAETAPTGDSRQLGIGVIGCGGIARHAHLPNIARNPRARLVAVCDIDLDRAKATAEEFGDGSTVAYQDFHDLLANPDVEMVCVTTWAAAHAEPVIAAAQAGKHILCEKPIAISIAEADAMVKAAHDAGVKFAMGYQPRFGTLWPRVKQIIDDGLLGEIMGATLASAAPSAHGVPWFLKKDLAGGGILIDWGIYTAYTLNWWLGPIERVYATAKTFRKEVMVRDQLITDIDVEDTVAAQLSFASGAMGTWYSAWAVKANHGHTAIDGREGSLVLQGNTIRLKSTRINDPSYIAGWHEIDATDPPLVDMHYRKVAHLVDAVLDDTPLVLTGEDGRDALEVVLAIYKSAETGQPIDLPMAREALVGA
ncbi:MAG TPA: Gfo/Idh/MocA family oxidoreductase [Thermomicrobiales bacterium]|nr:Gfo/Idh/MocA family oxidoreductase [Thermomicrobiales bacterium]